MQYRTILIVVRLTRSARHLPHIRYIPAGSVLWGSLLINSQLLRHLQSERLNIVLLECIVAYNKEISSARLLQNTNYYSKTNHQHVFDSSGVAFAWRLRRSPRARLLHILPVEFPIIRLVHTNVQPKVNVFQTLQRTIITGWLWHAMICSTDRSLACQGRKASLSVLRSLLTPREDYRWVFCMRCLPARCEWSVEGNTYWDSNLHAPDFILVLHFAPWQLTVEELDHHEE